MFARNSIFLIAFALLPLTAARAAETASEDANQLSLQVSALRTLYTLNLSRDQLTQLKTLANGDADTSPRKPASVTPKLASALHAAKAALLANDDDAISDADDALDEAWDTESYEIADSVAITDAARLAAPQALKLLTAGQTVTYIAQISSDVFEPAEGLMEAADDAPGKSDAEFTELKNKTAEDVAYAVAGLDKAKTDALKEKVGAWLTTIHVMKPEDEGQQRATLETQAKDLVGTTDSLTIIRNELLRNLAELLANPQTPAMIDARLHAFQSK